MVDIQGSDTIGSGRVAPYKYDVTDKTKQLHIECKCYSSNNGRILKQWIQKTVDECAMCTTKFPTIVIAHPSDILKYIACIDSSITEYITVPELYGASIQGVSGISLEDNDRSFRIKEVVSMHFFNTVRIPLRHRTIELLIFDRQGLIKIAKLLEATSE